MVHARPQEPAGNAPGIRQGDGAVERAGLPGVDVVDAAGEGDEGLVSADAERAAKVAVVRADGETTYEVALPFSELRFLIPRMWAGICPAAGFDILANDRDADPGERRAKTKVIELAGGIWNGK